MNACRSAFGLAFTVALLPLVFVPDIGEVPPGELTAYTGDGLDCLSGNDDCTGSPNKPLLYLCAST